jgi:hypothetical protein
LDAGIKPQRAFAFDTDLKEQPIGIAQEWPRGGGTDLSSALQKYVARKDRAESGKILVLTDADGLRQFNMVIIRPEFAQLNARCVNLTEGLDSHSIVSWLGT